MRTEKFEIYVRERRSGDYTFVGDTKQDTTEQSYVIKGLKYDTTYDILVRVLNKYGEAEDFASVRETTLKQNQDYKEKEKVEAVDKETLDRNSRQAGSNRRYFVLHSRN